MKTIPYPAFVGGSYESLAVTADQERTVNYYVERMESPGASSRSALYPTPGVDEFSRTAITDPAAPTVSRVGAAGASTYGYEIVGLLSDGSMHTAASPETQVASCRPAPDASNYQQISWTALTNAVNYSIYRTTAGGGGTALTAPVLLGTTTSLTFNDTGIVGTSASAPTTNTTGLPAGGGRAHYCQDDREFGVIGTTLYEIGSDGGLTNRGTVAIGSDPATISSNGDGGGELLITSGSNGYIYDLNANTLAQVAALNGKASQGDFLNGYFLVLDATSSTFYISALLDGTTWNTGTAFAQRSAGSDPWRALRVIGQFIWLLGELTSEVWYDTGTGSFPFALHPSGRVSYGIAANFSVATADGTLLWLGQSKIGQRFVLRASGFTPEVVSDFPRQRLFDAYAKVSDAQAETINYLGHVFYLLNFPAEDITWVFDAQTSQWCEWGTWISEDNRYAAWRPRWHVMAFGEHRMLDAGTGSLYRIGQAFSTDVDGRPIRRLRRAPGLTDNNERVFYSSFEVDLEPGLGAVTGQGVDPQIMMRFSDDGGKTWSSERWRSMGALGNYLARQIWDRLGSARRRVYELVVSDPYSTRITDAYLGLGQPISNQKGQAA